MWSSSRAWKDGSILPPDRWPATEITESDGTLRFVLKDGTEIHRIGILAQVYDYQTGRLVGHFRSQTTFRAVSR